MKSEVVTKLSLSVSTLAEFERACVRHLHLGPGVVPQRLARWDEVEIVEGLQVGGVGGFFFFIPADRVAYVSWHYAQDGRLSFPVVQVSDDFSDLNLPEKINWERVAEEMEGEDLSTRAIA